jgi:predicted metal-binding membrane protein
MTLNPVAVAIFVSSWTIGMAAMMFPAIVPMVLLYNHMIYNSHNDNNALMMPNQCLAVLSRMLVILNKRKTGFFVDVSVFSFAC